MPSMTDCPHCSAVVPSGRFCSSCGRLLEARPDEVTQAPPGPTPGLSGGPIHPLSDKSRVPIARSEGSASGVTKRRPHATKQWPWLVAAGVVVMLVVVAGTWVLGRPALSTLADAAASNSGSASPAPLTSTSVDPGATPSPTQTGSGNSSPTDWSVDNYGQWIGVPPAFPTTVAHWRLNGQWTTTARAFGGEWTAASGPGYSDFPATMNGCGQSLTLVRWKALEGHTLVNASDGAAGLTGPMGPTKSGNAGWMTFNGCQVPLFEFVSGPNGSTLVDIAVEVQQYAVGV